ncbi:MAG TPA: sodium:solute symporter [Rhizomicrobium sp.]|jgi:SSS family solute:Na+ symporter|nr:sodium:solute symporter [Rhizomicrobium sp.]
MSISPVTIIVFALLFAAVALLGLLGSRWRAGDLSQLSEWGLGGRSFGTLITWFLLGGDLYTAYTFIAVPALMFGAGATGFFAVPYAALMYPLLFLAFPRLWSVASRHGYITAADFVRGRFGHRGLALAIAVTGLVAVMPYIALQLVGMQVVIAALGLDWTVTLPLLGSVSLPLLAAFFVLAAFTYTSGLRGTALIAVAKDLLVYITVLAAIIIIPAELGGYAKVFAAVPPQQLLLAPAPDHNLGAGFAYVTLALGSLLALFLYPHSVTGILSSSSRHVIRRNAIVLPAYSVALALIALLGYMAVASGVNRMPEYAAGFKSFGNNFAVPALFLHMFPHWFAGLAFAAIAIGAMMPASIMAIACGNLFTRNIYKEFIAPDCTPQTEARMAKIVAFMAKLGALFFVLELQTTYAIQLQLLGGIWICQTVPAVLLALYVRLDPRALLAGWAAGVGLGTWMVASLGFKSSTYPLHIAGWTIPCYAAVSALAVNLVLSVVLTWVLKATTGMQTTDSTMAEDYV